MDASQKGEYTKVPIRVQDREWDAEVRGGLLALKGRLKYKRRAGGGKRGTIHTFSRQSRFRMFKMIATIDWPQHKTGLFITLTYPDEVGIPDAYLRMRELAEFMRKMERHLGTRVSALWRCEWKERLSGINKGEFVPHFHLIVFSVRYIPYRELNLWWKDTIGAKGYVRTEVKRLGSRKAHGIYVAKYCAKVPEVGSLVNVAYSRIDGKHWGYYGLKRLPRARRRFFSNISLATVETFRNTAAATLPWYDKDCDAGFVMIGKLGEKLAKKALALLLTKEVENPITAPIKGESGHASRQRPT